MRVRIDFGRVLPGILLLLSGLLIFAVLLVVAVITYLFSFNSTAEQVLHYSVGLMLLPVFLIAAGVAAMLTGVNWWGKGGNGWLSGIGDARARMDRLRLSNRIGEVFGAFIAFIIFLFLYENQLRGSAFFAPSFDVNAAFFFYGPLVAGTIISLTRAAYGRRNAVRPFDSLNALFLAVSAFWLLSYFPLDFTQLGGMFPSEIQFIFSWLTNEIGRLLLLVAGIAALANFAYTASLYVVVKGQMARAQDGGILSHPHGLS
jgi:hypothetical protein